MAIVNAKYRITWARRGYSGNLSITYPYIYIPVNNSGNNPGIGHAEGNTSIPPLLQGDGAFPLHTWLVKAYSHATLSAVQKYVNYRLSNAHMVTQNAFGKVKDHRKALYR